MDLLDKRVLITGANGFIGSFIAEKLVEIGAKPVCLIRKTSNLERLNLNGIELVYGEITQKDSLKGIFKDIDCVIHSAGAKKGLLLEDYLKVNAAGTRNLIEEVISSNPGLKKFVFLSSMAAMGPAIEGKASCENDRCSPITYYGISKLKGEEVVLEYLNKIPVTILRPPAVYGPKDEDIYSLFKAVKYGIKPIFGFRTRYINLCYVEDLADAVILSLSSPVSGGKTYIIGDVKDYSWDEIQEEAASVLKIKAFKVRIPAALLFTAGFIAETVSRVTGKTGIISRQKFKEMLEEWRCDITKAKTELGFTPKYTMKEGIKKTVNWYKDNGWL